MASLAPTITTLTMDQLRLGYPIVQQHQNQWYGVFVTYLERDRDEQGGNSMKLELSDLLEAQSRIFESEDFADKGMPMPLPIFDQKINYGDASGAKYQTTHENRLLKLISPEDIADVAPDIDHRTLRYAAQTLYPDVTVTASNETYAHTGRIRAVGFGLGGAVLGLVVRNRMSTSCKKNPSLWSDVFIDAQQAEVTVHDDCSPGRTLLTFNRLRSFEAFPHA